MAIGILLDTFFVRAVLVPAILATIGPASAWPGRFRRPSRRIKPKIVSAGAGDLRSRS